MNDHLLPPKEHVSLRVLFAFEQDLIRSVDTGPQMRNRYHQTVVRGQPTLGHRQVRVCAHRHNQMRLVLLYVLARQTEPAVYTSAHSTMIKALY